jgi:hypothetical protein
MKVLIQNQHYNFQLVKLIEIRNDNIAIVEDLFNGLRVAINSNRIIKTK